MDKLIDVDELKSRLNDKGIDSSVLVFSTESNNWEPESVSVYGNPSPLTLATDISSPVYTLQDVLAELSKRPTKLENCGHCGGSVDNKGYCRYCGSRVYMIPDSSEYYPSF